MFTKGCASLCFIDIVTLLLQIFDFFIQYAHVPLHDFSAYRLLTQCLHEHLIVQFDLNIFFLHLFEVDLFLVHKIPNDKSPNDGITHIELYRLFSALITTAYNDFYVILVINLCNDTGHSIQFRVANIRIRYIAISLIAKTFSPRVSNHKKLGIIRITHNDHCMITKICRFYFFVCRTFYKSRNSVE